MVCINVKKIARTAVLLVGVGIPAAAVAHMALFAGLVELVTL